MWLFVPAVLAGELLIADARLWDGTGAAVREGVDILVRDDRIVDIREHDGGDAVRETDARRVLDARGATVIPGLIDSHVHLSMDPGAAWRRDTPDDHRRFLAQHLRAYLACGVTTVLDPAVLSAPLAEIRGMLDGGAPGPRYLALGTPFSPKGGYVAAVIPGFPGVSTVAEVEALLDLAVREGAVGIKVTMERGFATEVWPVHGPEIRAAIRAGAARRGLPVYVHAMSPEEQAIGIEELGARATVHPLERYDAAVVAAAAGRGVYEMTTLSTVDDSRFGWEPERLRDPLWLLTVPPAQLASAGERRVKVGYRRGIIATLYPRLPGKRLAAASPGIRIVTNQRLRRTGRALRALRDAGVPVVMGSDAGNWPLIPYLFHGPTSIRELELIGEAGFSPAEALATATRNAAAMLGQLGEFGTVEVGKVADLVVVEGDPLADLSALRQVRWTVKGGVAATPEAWMGE